MSIGLALFWLASLAGATVFPVGSDVAVTRLTEYITMYEDGSGQMTITEAVAREAEGGFARIGARIPSFGYTRNAIWLHFRVRSITEDAEALMVELSSSRLSNVDWYVLDPGHAPERWTSSWKPEPGVRAIRARYPMAVLMARPDVETSVFVRIQSETAIALPLHAASPHAYSSRVEKRAVLAYGHLGMVITILVIGGIAGLVLRRRLFWLLASIAFFYVAHDVLFNGVYAWLGGPWMGYALRNVVLATGLAQCIAMVAFTFHYVGEPQIGSVATHGFRIAIRVLLGALGAVLILPFRWAVPLSHVSIPISLALGLVIAVRSSLRGGGRVHLLLTAWLLLAGVGAFLFLQWYAAIPFFVEPSVMLRALNPAIFLLFLLAIFEMQMLAYRQEGQGLRMERMTADARLHALRYQVNPHFLYNTLSSIEGLAIETPERVPALVRKLAAFLRQHLESKADWTTTLETELTSARNYLGIEQVRFEDRLRVDYDVTPDANACPVPELLLQPLLENAIKHGMDSAEPLRIRIAARVEEGMLEVRVENTKPQTAKSGGEPGFGVGLSNLSDRLNNLYAGRARFRLVEENGYMVAVVRLPANGAP